MNRIRKNHEEFFEKEDERLELPEAVEFVLDGDGAVDSGVRGGDLRDIEDENVLLHRGNHRRVRHHRRIDFGLDHLHGALDVLRFNPSRETNLHRADPGNVHQNVDDLVEQILVIHDHNVHIRRRNHQSRSRTPVQLPLSPLHGAHLDLRVAELIVDDPRELVHRH